MVVRCCAAALPRAIIETSHMSQKTRDENDPCAAESVPARATRREWLGLAVLAFPAMLLSMDLTVLYLAVPALAAEFRPSSAQLLWITDIYGFLIAGSLITMGTLGDRIGRRKLLLIGGAAFAWLRCSPPSRSVPKC